MTLYKSLLCLILQIAISVSVPAPASESMPEIVPVIINGIPVRIEEFPFFAGIRSGDSICGGAILSERWVLTAAHCVKTFTTNGLKLVYVGGERIDNSIQVEYSRHIRHPQYTNNSPLNDIALLELATPLKFNSKVKPVKLPRALTSNPRLTALGRGYDETRQISATLKKIDFLRMTPNDCINVFRPNGLTYLDTQLREQSIICGTRAEGRGPGICQGDSGSPLVDNDTIIGVTSFFLDPGKQKNCFASNFAGYINVAAYRQWITSVTGLM